MRTSLLAGLTLAGLLSASGCSESSSSPTAGGTPSSAPRSGTSGPLPPHEDCPVAERGKKGRSVAIDYIDFVQAFGRQYAAGLGGHEVEATRKDVGRVVLHVRCSLSRLNDRTHQAPTHTRNGDAGFLTPGTPVHAMRGWSPRCRLVAKHDGQLHVYLAQKPGGRVATPRPCAT